MADGRSTTPLDLELCPERESAGPEPIEVNEREEEGMEVDDPDNIPEPMEDVQREEEDMEVDETINTPEPIWDELDRQNVNILASLMYD